MRQPAEMTTKLKRLSNLLRHGSYIDRLRAVDAMGKFGDPRCVPLLRAIATKDFPRVRAAAVRALRGLEPTASRVRFVRRKMVGHPPNEAPMTMVSETAQAVKSTFWNSLARTG